MNEDSELLRNAPPDALTYRVPVLPPPPRIGEPFRDRLPQPLPVKVYRRAAPGCEWKLDIEASRASGLNV